ncbi:hypothetical protein Droror1_Dr00005197 [Drosera rotundifolia]
MIIYDCLVEKLGIKEYLPPYLNQSLEFQDLVTGVNFATGATGYDPVSAQLATVKSLDDQLELFKDYKTRMTAAIGNSKASKLISESAYLIFAGSNDITNTYFLTNLRRPQYDVDSYTDLLVSFASKFYQALYAEGVRTMGVMNIPPIGCLPSQRTLAGGLRRSCVDEYNKAALLFNSKLNTEIESLNRNLSGAAIFFLDVYAPLLDLINNPSQAGFEVVDKGCCGTGNIEVSILCNRLEYLLTCKDATKYIFWDSFHPTEATYRYIVDKTIKDDINFFY